MSGYIYLITNRVNQKKYVGQTRTTIKERYKKHIKTSRTSNRHLYCAMRKYGIENFIIEELEYVENDNQLDIREQYWISYYNSYYNGYNETKGGSGNLQYNYDEIYEYYIANQQNTTKTAQHFNCDISVVLNARRNHNDNPSKYFISDKIKCSVEQELLAGKAINKIAKKYNIHPDSIARIKKELNIPICQYQYQKEKQAKKIIGINIETKEKHFFNSIRDAARWLGNINYNQNISACLHKKQKTAYGYVWIYQ